MRIAGIAAGVALGAALLQASFAAAFPGDETFASPGQLVPVSNRELNFYCAGQGSVTVVLEAGLGMRASRWSRVQPTIARFARVCSYDRAGYGFSSPARGPRTASRLADDLHQALKAGRIPGPYLIVATSFGAFPARLFVHRFRREVAGLILLNPSPEQEELTPAPPLIEKIDNDGLSHAMACAEAALAGELRHAGSKRDACVPPPDPQLSATLSTARTAQLESPAAWRAIVGEWSAIRTSAAEVADLRPRRIDVPTVIVSASEVPTFDGSPEYKAVLGDAARRWLAWQDDLAALAKKGTRVRTPGSSRAAELAFPDVVVEAVRTVLSDVQARASKRG